MQKTLQYKVKSLYSISYRNHIDRMCYSDIKAYSERQALFIFHKYHTDCKEIIQVNKN